MHRNACGIAFDRHRTLVRANARSAFDGQALETIDQRLPATVEIQDIARQGAAQLVAAYAGRKTLVVGDKRRDVEWRPQHGGQVAATGSPQDPVPPHSCDRASASPTG